ncbi:HGxxPAAW family protein [Glutamicibacter creatinolyticus]|uniref:Uncharacterized protein n=1 Tax=Glutamicibacter creatinolyticus TaxID=162496 RepID=A0A5B7WU80_9MICC|nr:MULTISPECIES: HGxxPAAW family protein [Micrococcaceae]QCY47447.1 hypothetical protein GcLGCM259_1724 [Glutamicibacter creatinolyticus]TLK49787.1 hypothetical protein FDN03_13325 [Glutamicibacter sp. V16R2B1]
MSQKTEIDPIFAEEVGHGNSIAAWTAVIIMMVGAIVGGIAFANHAHLLVYISCGVILLGLVVGWIMRKAGYGVGGSRSGAHH